MTVADVALDAIGKLVVVLYEVAEEKLLLMGRVTCLYCTLSQIPLLSQ